MCIRDSLNTDQETDPVIFFPTYSSLYVRMLLQFFYTGEVTTMTQRDIEPLREICYSLGITSLMTRLDDVKLSISFQNIPSYDTNIPSVTTTATLRRKANPSLIPLLMIHHNSNLLLLLNLIPLNKVNHLK